MTLRDKEKFIYKTYNKKFIELFKREKRKLANLLPKKSKIEHIGSTAVSGLAGKGIIDILISVDKKNVNKTKKILEKNYNLIGEKPERIFFDKTYIYNRKERFVHLHLTHKGSLEEKKHILLVKYLKLHPDEAKKYGEIKRKATIYAKGDRDKYLNYKKKFVEGLNKKALKLNP